MKGQDGEEKKIGAERRKISIVRILQVLLRESDKEHPLSQQQILEHLKEKYGMEVNRKSVARNLMRLKEEGLPVYCREVMRTIKGKAAPLYLDWYWDHHVTEEELQMIIDVLYASHLPYGKIKSLSDKLKHVQSRSFDDGKEEVRNLPASGEGEDVRSLVSILTKGIREKKKVRFLLSHYEADGKKHIRLGLDGTEKVYMLSPYALASSDGDYYVLGAIDGEEHGSLYRLDVMEEMTMTDEAARPSAEVRGLENGIKVTDFLRHISCVYEGESTTCAFVAPISLMNRIRRDFGKEAHVLSADPSRVTVEVTTSTALLKAWALSLSPQVQILSPAYLVKDVREAMFGAMRFYGDV